MKGSLLVGLKDDCKRLVVSFITEQKLWLATPHHVLYHAPTKVLTTYPKENWLNAEDLPK